MQQSFGEFLAEKRKLKNLTQKDLANKLFVSESAVSKWEKGVSHPDITSLPLLCKILNVTEHELITASEDESLKETNKRAKKWTNLCTAWELFFYICYGLALITCFIVNLATRGTLSWFWIVFSAIIFASSFTTLPKFVKKMKFLITTISQLLLLILLLGVCCLSTKGNWFFVCSAPIISFFTIIFLPIYISLYNFPKFFKNNSAMFCVLIDYVVLFLAILVIENFSKFSWAWGIYATISLVVLGFVLGVVAILRYAKINKYLKTSCVLLVITFFIVACYATISSVLKKQLNIVMDTLNLPNFLDWSTNQIQSNVVAIIYIVMLTLSVVFAILGFVKLKNNRKNK